MIRLRYWQHTTSIALIVILSCSMNTNASPRNENETQQHTPETEETFSLAEDCSRPCRVGEKPRICHYEFVLELYVTMGRPCDSCKPNCTNPLTNIPHCQCIEADGFERAVLSVNRMVPGPSIQVCKGDMIDVVAVNHMPAMACGLHWHGMLQHGSQYYDGVPFVTQCPIEFGTSFRYTFSADSSGTHFWHAHAGLQKGNGLYGSLIVRDAADPSAHLYDNDLPCHAFVISDWGHELAENMFPGRFRHHLGQLPENILINGKGRWRDPSTNQTTSVQLETFTVKHGERYRFRMINSFFSVLSAVLTIEGHSLKLIAQDGVSVHPVIVNAIKSWSGERVDFVLDANCTNTSYLMRVCSDFGIKKICQVAILTCEGGPDISEKAESDSQSEVGEKVLYNPDDGSCNVDRSHAICPNQLIPIEEPPAGLLTAHTDEIYLPIRIHSFENETQDFFAPGQYRRFMMGTNGVPETSSIDDISFVFPRVPPLYQPITTNETCNRHHLPQNCDYPCECTHVYDIEMSAFVTLYIWDAGEGGPPMHPFHFHGHLFYVLALGCFENGTSPEDGIKEVVNEHKRKLETGQYSNPAAKDTIAVPKHGYVILRFKADNPGYWLFHCHVVYHISFGMALLFHVGDQGDLPPVPADFRKCGNFA